MVPDHRVALRRHCLFPPILPRGKILSIDTTAALELPGVHVIYTNKDLAAIKVEMLSFFLTPPTVPITPLANGSVAYLGDPVALVIADDRYIAEDAASLIDIQYAEEDPVVTISDAKTGAPVHAGTDNNIAAIMGVEEPDKDFEAILQSAPCLVTHRVTHQRIAQSPMETRGVIVTREGTEELTLKYDVQIEGDNLTGKVKMDFFGNAKLTGERLS
jgi:carbon-monoxide dehydrogenase large subunit